MKPAEFLKVRTREGINGGVVMTGGHGERRSRNGIGSDKNKATHQLHGQGLTRGTRVDDCFDGMVVAKELNL